MAGRARKKYNPDDIRLGTFNIAHQKWEAFQDMCKAQNITASDGLNRLIDGAINDGNLPDSYNNESGKFREVLTDILNRLEALEKGKQVITEPVELPPGDAGIFASVEAHGLNHKEVEGLTGLPGVEIRGHGTRCEIICIDGVDYFYRKRVKLWFPVSVFPAPEGTKRIIPNKNNPI